MTHRASLHSQLLLGYALADKGPLEEKSEQSPTLDTGPKLQLRLLRAYQHNQQIIEICFRANEH